jgi:hypothetical protein
MTKKTLILAQLFISCMMAACMSGIMGFMALGPTTTWLQVWPRQFITAWPIAFVLSMAASRIGFALARRLTAAPQID